MNNEAHENKYVAEFTALNELTTQDRMRYDQWHTLKYVNTCDGRTNDVLKTPLKDQCDSGLEMKLDTMMHEGLVEKRDISHWVFWTRPAYFISEQGRQILQQEQEKLTRVGEAIASAGKENAADVIKTQGYEPLDYSIMKSILLNGIFDHETTGIFMRELKLGDYISSRYDKSIEKAREYQCQRANDDDGGDLLTTFLLMDVITDGQLDFNFSPDSFDSLDVGSSDFDGGGDFD